MDDRPGTMLGVIALATAATAADTGPHWSYSGATGPDRWASLETDYATCRIGKAQSPIDIDGTQALPQELPPLQFKYRSAPLRITDNGHTIQIDVPSGSALRVGRSSYTLVQFHFHHPSEETIDGKRFAMVAHFVHRDPAGQLAVVAVPLQSGPANPLVAKLWHNLPHAVGKQQAPAGVAIDPSGLLPASLGYYTYVGSLTTPPCSEGVRWFVLKAPVTLSPDQIAAFARIYPDNARPTQPFNGRIVLASR